MRRRLPIFFALVMAMAMAIVTATPCFAAWDYQSVAGAGDVPLHVVTVGNQDNPAILFIHGIGQSHYSFVRQFNSKLADDFYLVSFDLRGHGASGKPWAEEAYGDSRVWAEDVAAVIAASGADRPVVVAWSYGTLVVMDFVREFGVEALAGINLTGALGALRPFRMPAPDDPIVAEFAQVRELQMSPSLADNIKASERMVDWLTATPLDDTERELFRTISLMFPVYARRAMLGRAPDNGDLLEGLRVPVLFSLGHEDNPANLEDATELAAHYGNMSLSGYENAGHSVFFEQPERFNSELRRFASRAHTRGEK